MKRSIVLTGYDVNGGVVFDKPIGTRSDNEEMLDIPDQLPAKLNAIMGENPTAVRVVVDIAW